MKKLRTLFKAEIIAPFRLLYGFVFLICYWGILAYLAITHNLSFTAVDISGVLSSMTLAVALLVPVITHFNGLIPEKRRVSAVDTLPFNAFERAGARLLANLTIIGIATAPLLLLPIINGYFGVSDYLLSYSALLAFFVFEILLVSISQYFAVRIKNEVLSVVAVYSCFVVLFLMGSAKVLIPRSAVVSFVGVEVISILIGLLVFALTRRKLLSALCTVVLAALPVPYFLLARDSFEGVLEKIVEAFSIFRRFDSFAMGAFDLHAIVLYLALSLALFLLLAKAYTKNGIKRLKMFFSGKTAFRVATCCASALLVVSIFASVSPMGSFAFDSTQNKKYSVSETTKNYIDGLDTEVTLYFINPTSADEGVGIFLQRYAALSKNITLKEIYPSTDAHFFEEYGLNAEKIDAGSILVASDKRNMLVYPDDLYSYTNEAYGLKGVDNSAYSQYLYYAYLYNQEAYESLVYETIICFEGDYVITSYIEYVTRENLPTTFILSGHGESELSEDTLKAFEGYGITVDTLNTEEHLEIPDYASGIIINAPEKDISEEEYDALSEYLSDGGQITFLTTVENLEMENLTRLLADYGMRASVGAVVVTEDSAELEATVKVSHDITATLVQLSQSPVYLFEASYIRFTENEKDSLLCTPLLVSSDKADALCVAAAAETADGARIVWITGAEDFDSHTEDYSNLEMLICSSFWTVRGYESELGKIDPVIYEYPSVKIESAMAGMFKAFFIALPVLTLAYGAFSFIKRRRMNKTK